MTGGYFVVHFTVVNPAEDSTYGTGAPHAVIGSALADCTDKMRAGRRAFITERDEDGQVVSVIPPVILDGALNLSAEELERIVTTAKRGTLDVPADPR